MNKKEEKWRMEGALYALRLAKEKGIDYLEMDIKRRGALGMPFTIPEKVAREAYDMLANKVMNTMKTVAMWTLYTKDGWRGKRLQRFEEQMDEISNDCMTYDRYGKSYVKISDMAKELQERCGVTPDLTTLEQIEKENEANRGKFISLDAVVEVMEELGIPKVAEALERKVQENG